MKVKIYVNWEEREICKEEELENIKKERVTGILGNPYDRRTSAYDFICEKEIYAEEIFLMDDKERNELLTDFEKYVEECVAESIENEYEAITIEV
jgi:hypothetical protein